MTDNTDGRFEQTTPNGTVPEKTLGRVRKLLTKAENTDNEHERETFNRAAAVMMARYGIARAMLAQSDPTSDKLSSKRIVIDVPYARLSGFFLIWIMEACRGSGFMNIRPATVRGNEHIVHLYGYESDIERVELLWTSLLVQRTLGLASADVPDYDTPRAYRRAWVAGFHAVAVGRIALSETRATEQAVAESGAGSGMELVLASRREVATRKMHAENPRIRKVKSVSSSRAGYQDGAEAGERADVGGTKLGRPAARQLQRGAR